MDSEPWESREQAMRQSAKWCGAVMMASSPICLMVALAIDDNARAVGLAALAVGLFLAAYTNGGGGGICWISATGRKLPSNTLAVQCRVSGDALTPNQLYANASRPNGLAQGRRVAAPMPANA